jgi:hypothetical protein
VGRQTSAGSIDDYVVKYGDNINVFLIIQLFVNHWPNYADGRSDRNGNPIPMPNAIGEAIRDGRTNWSISNRTLKAGNDIFTAPWGWDTPVTGRRDCYDEAIRIFR